MSPLAPRARFSAPLDLSPGRVRAALAELGAVNQGPPEQLLRQWLDTFDWRLWAAGARLVLESGGGADRLRWLSSGSEPEVALPAAPPPLRSAGLPETLAGRRIAGLIENRALYPRAGCRVRRTTLAVFDAEGKTVVRVAVERCRDLADDGSAVAPERVTVSVEGLAGYPREHEATEAAVTKRLGLDREPDDELAVAAAASGLSPGDYSSRPRLVVGADEPAETAVRRYLAALLDVAEANVAGIRADLDVEFLHDLRVAVRRSRSALGQLKGLVPADVRAKVIPELRWLGTVTGPCRDLDVYLEELDGLVAEAGLTDPEVLAPFRELLRRQRSRAHQELVGALEAPRFGAFVAAWRELLATPFAGDAGRPVAEVARARTRRAHRRTLRNGVELGPDSPPERFHQLRIDAKKLRYLLELFAGVLDEGRTEAAVRELKRIQDVLGGLQDVAVQRTRLTAAAEALLAERHHAAAPTLLAMGRLLAALDRRERDLRGAFHERFECFAGSGGRATFAALLSPEEGP